MAMRVRLFGTGDELVVDDDAGNRMIARAEATYLGAADKVPKALSQSPVQRKTVRGEDSVPSPSGE